MNILAIETSCDETACAVVEDLPAGRQVELKILSSVVASSKEMHDKYGGIVPEIAAREQLKCIIPVIEEALSIYTSSDESSRSREVVSDSSLPIKSGSNNMKNMIDEHIDAIAVTVGPGLIGSLLVGVETAKTIAFVTGKPIIPVNHVLAHMYANFIPSAPEGQNSSRVHPKDNLIKFPAISLVVSGGHTELYLMKSVKDLTWLGGTLDDAAGECFDKSARLLGFGNQGGPAIAKTASKFDIQHSTFSIHLPRPMLKDESLNFSFSGLKTAIVREWKKSHQPTSLSVIPAQAGIQPKKNTRSPIRSGMTTEHENINDQSLINAFAFEIQEAITDVLVEKTIRAAEIHKAKSILLSGGVAANTRLRGKFQSAISPPAGEAGTQPSAVSFFFPPKELCTDNAVYIGSYAFFRGTPTDWHEITAFPDLNVEAQTTSFFQQSTTQ